MAQGSVHFTVLASGACRVCGDVYGLVLPSGAASAAVRAMDTGMCAKCHAEDNNADLVTIQVVDEFEDMSWAQDWDAQAKEQVSRYLAKRRERYAEPSTEERTCPVCFNDFEVEVHVRGGRVREYCCVTCRGTAEKRRYRDRVRGGCE